MTKLEPYKCGTCGSDKLKLAGAEAGILAGCTTCGRGHEDACMEWALKALAEPPPKEHLDVGAVPASAG